jgi:hypothetical protein
MIVRLFKFVPSSSFRVSQAQRLVVVRLGPVMTPPESVTADSPADRVESATY